MRFRDREVHDNSDLGVREQFRDAACSRHTIFCGACTRTLQVKVRTGGDLQDVEAAGSCQIDAADCATTDDPDLRSLHTSASVLLATGPDQATAHDLASFRHIEI